MNLLDKIKSFFTKVKDNSDKVKTEKAQKIIGYHFHDQDLLLLSLTHRSFSRYENNNNNPANERLEFLGDSVLGMVISYKLFEDYGEFREGELTKKKAMLVNEVTLSNLGKKIGLNECIRMSIEEERSGGRERPSIVSDTFESVIAAVYLDGGIESATDIIIRLIYANRNTILNDSSQRNYKGELLELAQARGEGMPLYEVIGEEGPDHDKIFNLEVYVANKKVGEGSGSSKKEAEQKAASMAIDHFKKHEIDS